MKHYLGNYTIKTRGLQRNAVDNSYFKQKPSLEKPKKRPKKLA